MREDCHKFATLITGYIDDELGDLDKRGVKSHLAECAKCKQMYIEELRVKKTIKDRLPVYEAPVALQRRIRRQLARSETKPGFWQLLHPIFLYRPLAASMSLACIALLILFPIYQRAATQEDSTALSSNTELKGEILCLDCAVFSKEEGDQHPMVHRAGIMTEDHRIWTFVNETSLGNMLHSELAKKKARIVGDLFPSARYVYVKRYELL